MSRSCLSIVLAAGEGTRMASRRPKVLHPLAGQPLIGHVLAALKAAGSPDLAVVIGPGHELIADLVNSTWPGAGIFVQQERLGTAHAVLSARAAIARGFDEVVILCGDAPLIMPETLLRLRAGLADGALAVLGFNAVDPSGYGRLIVENGQLVAIREECDASPAERAVTFCNAGCLAIRGDIALQVLDQIGNKNAKREYYLTDAVGIARAMNLKVVAIEASEDELRGINTKAQLAEAEAIMQIRLRRKAMDAGVTLIAPETIFLSADTNFGTDVTVEPHVVFGPGVSVEDESVIHSFSHLERAHVGRGNSIGPFARLRPGANLGEGVRIGNFVEIKAALIENGAKVNHLSYVGDAHIGAGANVGAGTITCNYDGVAKHKTEIGKGAFIGSNTALVAPVRIGDRAYVGSGSVITQDVPDDALAIGRGRQVVKEGWAVLQKQLSSVAFKPKKE